MRKFGIVILLGLLISLAACGNGSKSNDVTGTWTATLTSSTGVTQFVFKMDLAQSGTTNVSASNFTFTSGAPCFATISSATGQFSLNGTFQGVTTNTLILTITGAEAGESGFNTLDMQGAVNGNTVTGAWVLTGTAGGCTGSGNFTMSR